MDLRHPRISGLDDVDGLAAILGQDHEYLAAGLPIASGAVEGACRNLIKDRMERSGMRWTIEEAEAMVRLRATYVSGDFEDYWRFHVRQDQARLHPAGRWEAVVAK